MKNILKHSAIAILFMTVVSCVPTEDSDLTVIVPSETPELLAPTTGAAYTLSKANSSETVATFIWDYSKYDGTQTVINYEIEIAKAGTDFKVISIAAKTTERFVSLTVAQLNQAASSAGLPAFKTNDVDVRIKSYVGTNGVPQYSNVIQLTLTTYREPLPSSHWLVGAATPGGWSWSDDSETEFPLIIGRTDAYQVSIVLKGGEAFREFLGNNYTSDGNWDSSHNYTFFKDAGYTIDAELVDALDGDHNFKYIGETGERILTFDYAAKTITLE
jgi:hypothetical protein